MRNLTCSDLQILLVMIWLILKRVETELRILVTKYWIHVSAGRVSRGGGGR